MEDAPGSGQHIAHLFADLAVDGANPGGDGTLTYAVPAALAGQVRRGTAVWVPLRRRWALGIVLGVHDEPPSFETRPLQAMVDPPVTLDEARLQIAEWLARETASSRFAALGPFLPPGIAASAVEHLRLASPAPGHPPLTAAQQRLAAFLGERGEVSIETARRELDSSLASVIPRLEELGVLERTVRSPRPRPAVRGERFVRLLDERALPAGSRSAKQRAVADYLVQRRRFSPDGADHLVPASELIQRTGADRAAIAALAAKGVIEEIVIPGAVAADSGAETAVPVLSPAQADAWRAIEAALAERDSTPFLLHGVTGSGKTEVYLRAVAWCLRHGRGAIVLAPEITLASQVVRRFAARFPGQVAVLHSALSDGERSQTWQAIRDGTCRVVVGPRSALFAPMEGIGLIVIDEEHESAYKQDAEPRYHARALAERIGGAAGAVVVLGSATPSVETAWRAENGQVRLLVLPERVGPGAPGPDCQRRPGALELPPVEIVDMRLELHRGNASLFSQPLQETIADTLARDEQTILLLNRRGLATVVLCRACGHSLVCPWCDIPLVYHGDRGQLLCHRCDYRSIPPGRCPDCSGALDFFGAGTQRVEQEVRRLFPAARTLRWDQDTVRRKGSHDALLRQVERHEADIVIGTQMVAKGLDLPLVTAIGVVSADTMLHLPDFRAGERTFQLLTQVAGRAGRRGGGSRVVVQSYTPDHYAIRAAARHDYDAFYAEEIDFRRAHRYPPFGRMVRYVVRDADENRAAASAEEMARRVARHARDAGCEIEILGPTPAFAARVRGLYQWQFIVRSDDLEPLLDGLPAPPGWVVDVDPQSLL
ncbi:MAG: primosomal protein N' [Chloroflexota bacterium]